MPYNFASDSFHTKKLCSRLSSSEVHFLMKIGRFAFLRPLLGDLGATYDDHLRLIGKCVEDFLLALIVLSQSTRVTDGRTDGQTDRILLAIPRLHYMQRDKNEMFII